VNSRAIWFFAAALTAFIAVALTPPRCRRIKRELDRIWSGTRDLIHEFRVEVSDEQDRLRRRLEEKLEREVAATRSAFPPHSDAFPYSPAPAS